VLRRTSRKFVRSGKRRSQSLKIVEICWNLALVLHTLARLRRAKGTLLKPFTDLLDILAEVNSQIAGYDGFIYWALRGVEMIKIIREQKLLFTVWAKGFQTLQPMDWHSKPPLVGWLNIPVCLYYNSIPADYFKVRWEYAVVFRTSQGGEKTRNHYTIVPAPLWIQTNKTEYRLHIGRQGFSFSARQFCIIS
jgi:hypothetical protein